MKTTDWDFPNPNLLRSTKVPKFFDTIHTEQPEKWAYQFKGRLYFSRDTEATLFTRFDGENFREEQETQFKFYGEVLLDQLQEAYNDTGSLAIKKVMQDKYFLEFLEKLKDENTRNKLAKKAQEEQENRFYSPINKPIDWQIPNEE